MKLSNEYIIPALPHPAQRIIDMEVKRVCKYFQLTPHKIKSKTRKKEIVIPRQICMYRLRNIHNFSFEKIGRVFSKDHTTVVYTCNKIDDHKELYPEIKRYLKDLNY